jgi:hypothetical protein
MNAADGHHTKETYCMQQNSEKAFESQRRWDWPVRPDLGRNVDLQPGISQTGIAVVRKSAHRWLPVISQRARHAG